MIVKKGRVLPRLFLIWIDADRAYSKLDQRCRHDHQRRDNRDDADFRRKHKILIDLQMRLVLLVK